MHGIDVETTALGPEDGKLRLVQLSDEKTARVYEVLRQPEDVTYRRGGVTALTSGASFYT
jgi:hypothetical protein